MFSAKSVDGVCAYELARKLYKTGGAVSEIDDAAKELIRVARINISELELMKFEKGRAVSESADEAEAVAEDPGTHTDISKASSRINVTDNSALGLPRAVVRMACSKGTYVRAFARDLGEKLGSGAHLDSLQRSRSGIFLVQNALSIEQALNLL